MGNNSTSLNLKFLLWVNCIREEFAHIIHLFGVGKPTENQKDYKQWNWYLQQWNNRDLKSDKDTVYVFSEENVLLSQLAGEREELLKGAEQ